MSGEDGRYEVPADGKVRYFWQPLTAPELGTEGFVAGRIIRVAPDGSVTSFFAGSGGDRVNPNVPLDLVALPGSVQDLVSRRTGNIDADGSAAFTLGNTKFDRNVNRDWWIGGDAITDISIVLDFNRQALDGLPEGKRDGLVIHSSNGAQRNFTVTVDGETRTIRVPRSAGCVSLIGEECDRFADQFRRDLAAGNVDRNFVVIPTGVALVRGERTLTWAGTGSAPSGATYAAATPSPLPSPAPSSTGEGDEHSPAPTATDPSVTRRMADAGSAQPTETANSVFDSNALGNAIIAILSAIFGGGGNNWAMADAGSNGVPPEGGPTQVADVRTRTAPSPTIPV